MGQQPCRQCARDVDPDVAGCPYCGIAAPVQQARGGPHPLMVVVLVVAGLATAGYLAITKLPSGNEPQLDAGFLDAGGLIYVYNHERGTTSDCEAVVNRRYKAVSLYLPAPSEVPKYFGAENLIDDDGRRFDPGAEAIVRYRMTCMTPAGERTHKWTQSE